MIYSNAPKVSVVMASYNSEYLIEETLESVAEQTFRDFEVIIVDDWSEDQTVDYARSIIDKLRITGKVVERPAHSPKGAAGCRNFGVALASGEYVAFLDSDDLWLPHHLDRACRTLDNHRADIVAYCSTGEAFTGHQKLGPLPSEGFPAIGRANVLTYLLDGMFIPNVTIVCPRNVLLQTSGYHEALKCYEDWWLCLQLAKLGSFWLEPNPGCRIRVRSESLSRQVSAGRYGGMSRQMFDDRIALCNLARKCDFLDNVQVGVLVRNSINFLAESLYGSLRARFFVNSREIIALLVKSFPVKPYFTLRIIARTAKMIGKWFAESGLRYCSAAFWGKKDL